MSKLHCKFILKIKISPTVVNIQVRFVCNIRSYLHIPTIYSRYVEYTLDFGYFSIVIITIFTVSK